MSFFRSKYFAKCWIKVRRAEEIYLRRGVHWNSGGRQHYTAYFHRSPYSHHKLYLKKFNGSAFTTFSFVYVWSLNELSQLMKSLIAFPVSLVFKLIIWPSFKRIKIFLSYLINLSLETRENGNFNYFIILLKLFIKLFLLWKQYLLSIHFFIITFRVISLKTK